MPGSSAEGSRIRSLVPELELRPRDPGPRLAALQRRPLNFDPETLGGPGWQHDRYRQPLPAEQPGPPEQHGSWETAAALSRRYAFADPSLVEARYDPAAPLEGRDMLLILHALGACIYAGVRVSAAGTERRDHGGRRAEVSFWSYRTLDGHVEAGQRSFEVWKWLDTGEVEFRTRAVSRPAETGGIAGLGVRLLGRHRQVEFGRRACRRMALLTAIGLRDPNGSAPVEMLDGRLLSIYLRDHHSLLVVMGELARRMGSASRPADQRAFAGELGRAADDDRLSVAALLGGLDGAPSQLGHAAAWAAEKLGRLKLNGRIVRPSPLSAVTELEGCGSLLEGNRALWSGLGHLGIGPADASERARRAERLLGASETLRLDALNRAASHRADAAGRPR